MLIGAIIAVLILLISGYFLWQWMIAAPLYTPGMVRAGTNLRGPLEPPKQVGENSYWQVENDIRLFFTAQGEGRPILVVHGGPGFPVHRPLAGLELLTTTHKLYCYDQRGCGKSTRPFERFSSNYYSNIKELERTLGIGAQVADIERIRRILGEEKLILMGHHFDRKANSDRRDEIACRWPILDGYRFVSNYVCCLQNGLIDSVLCNASALVKEDYLQGRRPG